MRVAPVAIVVTVLGAASIQAADGPVTLLEAVKDGNRAAVRTLIGQRANVNAAEADGMTPLHWAVRSDDIEMARALIRAGANVKASSRYGITPVTLAAQNGNATML